MKGLSKKLEEIKEKDFKKVDKEALVKSVKEKINSKSVEK